MHLQVCMISACLPLIITSNVGVIIEITTYNQSPAHVPLYAQLAKHNGKQCFAVEYVLSYDNKINVAMKANYCISSANRILFHFIYFSFLLNSRLKGSPWTIGC